MTYADLRELAEKATPGPWIASGVTHEFGGDRFMFVNVEPLGEIARLPLPDRPAKGYAPTICDQRFIAAFNPATALAILDRLERAEKALDALVNAKALSGVRGLVSGWNGEDRPEPYNERHPPSLGATLPKTNCGAVYELDEAMQAARSVLALTKGTSNVSAPPANGRGE